MVDVDLLGGRYLWKPGHGHPVACNGDDEAGVPFKSGLVEKDICVLAMQIGISPYSFCNRSISALTMSLVLMFLAP